MLKNKYDANFLEKFLTSDNKAHNDNNIYSTYEIKGKLENYLRISKA